MRKFFGFLAGIMCGLVVGGVAALLLAPMPGTQLQERIGERVDQLKSEIESAVAEQEKRLRAEFERLKEGAA